jgi:hypothetical protein
VIEIVIFEEMSTLPYYKNTKGIVVNHYFLQIKMSPAFLAVSLPVIISLYLWRSNHKPTQTCRHHCLDDFEDGDQGYQQNSEDGC